MPSTITNCAIQFVMSTIEALAAGILPGLARTQTHDQLDVKLILTPTSTPPVSLYSEQTISGSASGSIDLTSLPTLDGARSASGLKLRAIRVINRGTHTFSIQIGASNGYVVGGLVLAVPAGGCGQLYLADGLAAVDGTHKTLDYTFNAGDSADVSIAMG